MIRICNNNYLQSILFTTTNKIPWLTSCFLLITKQHSSHNQHSPLKKVKHCESLSSPTLCTFKVHHDLALFFKPLAGTLFQTLFIPTLGNSLFVHVSTSTAMPWTWQMHTDANSWGLEKHTMYEQSKHSYEFVNPASLKKPSPEFLRKMNQL